MTPGMRVSIIHPYQQKKPMKKITLNSSDREQGFGEAKEMAGKEASVLLTGSILLSRCDAKRDMESPRGTGECHTGCELPGCVDYARSRGGSLIIDIDNGAYLFCYRELGEFSE